MARRSPPTEPWDVIYYRTSDGLVPADLFLDACPAKVRARILAVVDDVAGSPPPRFSGGGRWEVMRGSMAGIFEIRATGPRREQFRLFCILENGGADDLLRRGLSRPAIAVITGLRKPWMTTFTDAEYRAVRAFAEDHRRNHPRRIAE
ncbi:MAG: hypothetical protein WCH74_12140 [Chloroflexota bacterium]